MLGIFCQHTGMISLFSSSHCYCQMSFIFVSSLSSFHLILFVLFCNFTLMYQAVDLFLFPLAVSCDIFISLAPLLLIFSSIFYLILCAIFLFVADWILISRCWGEVWDASLGRCQDKIISLLSCHNPSWLDTFVFARNRYVLSRYI